MKKYKCSKKSETKLLMLATSVFFVLLVSEVGAQTITGAPGATWWSPSKPGTPDDMYLLVSPDGTIQGDWTNTANGLTTTSKWQFKPLREQ